MKTETIKNRAEHPEPPPRLGTFIPYVLRNHKKFRVKSGRNRSDKRCEEQNKINRNLISRAQHAWHNKGVYPLTSQEIEGKKLRLEREK